MNRFREVCWLPLVGAFLALVGTRVLADELPRALPESVGLSAEKLKAIDRVFANAVEQKQIAGSVVLIARKGKIAYLHRTGLANVESKKPMHADGIFRMASMTKAVTSVAAMILVDDGKIKLDDPVSKYLPEFKDQKVLVPGKSGKVDDYTLVPAEREITIRHLLTHTSGLIYTFSGNKCLVPLYEKAKINFGLVATTEKLADNIKRLAGLPLAHQPGQAFTYSLSTDVLGRVVEVASGKELNEFFHQRIFKPLAMRDTFFGVPKEKRNRLVAQYRQDENAKIASVVVGKDWVYNGTKNYYSGGAGLLSTAGDYARFLQMLLNGGRLGKARLLKPETVKLMTTNQVGKLFKFTTMFGDGFGLGFGVVTPDMKGKSPMSVGSYSWAGAFCTHFWVDPGKELVAVMLTQVSPWRGLTLVADFTKLTYEAIKTAESSNEKR